MKHFTSILSAAVLAALITFFAFDQCNAFAMMSGRVMMRVDSLILLFTVLTCGAASLAFALRAALDRKGEAKVRRLEQRVQELERQASGDVADAG